MSFPIGCAIDRLRTERARRASIDWPSRALQAADKTRFEHTRQGMSLAIEELNQQRGTLPPRQLVVLHVNADEDLDQLQATAVRLLTVNRAIALYGGHEAAQVERLTRAVQPYDAPLISPAITTPSLASDSLFSLEPAPARLAKIASRWLNETVKGDILAFAFDTRAPVAAALATALHRKAAAEGTSKIIETPFGVQTKINETCEAIRQSKAKACFFFGKTEDCLGLRRALRDASCKIPLLVLDSVGPLETLPRVPEMEGELYQITSYFVQEQDNASSSFQANYLKRFKIDADLFAAQGYDAVRLIAEASSSGKTNAAGKLAVDLNAYCKTPFAVLHRPALVRPGRTRSQSSSIPRAKDRQTPQTHLQSRSGPANVSGQQEKSPTYSPRNTLHA